MSAHVEGWLCIWLRIVEAGLGLCLEAVQPWGYQGILDQREHVAGLLKSSVRRECSNSGCHCGFMWGYFASYEHPYT